MTENRYSPCSYGCLVTCIRGRESRWPVRPVQFDIVISISNQKEFLKEKAESFGIEGLGDCKREELSGLCSLSVLYNSLSNLWPENVISKLECLHMSVTGCNRQNSADSVPTSNLFSIEEMAIRTSFSHMINIAGIMYYTCCSFIDIQCTRYKSAFNKRF